MKDRERMRGESKSRRAIQLDILSGGEDLLNQHETWEQSTSLMGM